MTESKSILLAALTAIALSWSASTASAVTLAKADFDTTFDGNAAGGRLIESAINATGACSEFKTSARATGNARCGNEFDRSSGIDTYTLSGINFDDVVSIKFSFAAEADNFEAGIDFLSVRANDVELVRFEAVQNGIKTLSSSLGSTLADGTFVDFMISGSDLDGAKETGDLVFEFFTTSRNENLGLDSVHVSAIPVPFGLPLLVSGFALMAGARRFRKKAA